MADERNVPEAKKRHPAMAPLLVTGLLLLLIGVCFQALWAANAPERLAALRDEELLDALQSRRAAQEKLLALDPCAAKKHARELSPVKPVETAPAPVNATGARGTTAPPQSAQFTGKPKLDAIEQACVFIISSDGKTSLSTGSGFFVTPEHVLTNRHVVEAGKEFIIIVNKNFGQPLRASLVAESKGKNSDFALLKVNLPSGLNVKALPLAANVNKTEKVGAWGFPAIVGKADPAYQRLLRGQDIGAAPELSYSEGVVSAVLERQPAIIVHTAPISPGNSGGPLINEAGEVVGINTMITLDETSYRQASLALAASDILGFLSQCDIKR